MSKRTAIITGASGGIGTAISCHLANLHYFVLLVDKADPSPACQKLVDEKKASFKQCDITIESDVKKLFNSLRNEIKTLDVLINNAGVLRDNLIANMTIDDFDTVLDVNLRAAWLMCREAAGWMKQQMHGHIVNITSRAWLGNKGQTNYSASKAGLVGLTRSLALELGKSGVIVNAVAPGLIDSPMTRNLPEKVLNKLLAAQPTGRMGSPDDVARLVAFLCDDKTTFINGQTIFIDGGKSIGANP